jgi:hypothetical protein
LKSYLLATLLLMSFPVWAVDREAVLRELRDPTLAGIDHRLGPDYASYHKGEAKTFPEVWMASSKQEKGGRRYQIGGPWSKKAGDFSSTQGQVLYVPDSGVAGVDRVTIEEWSNNCFSERPEAPWWGGFRPEPTYAKWKAAAPAGDPGIPRGMARGMASWANCGVIIFSSGLVGTAGTCTGHGSDPTFQFPPEKLLTGVSVTNKNEFALITLHDTKLHKGQVAILALESSGRVSKFAHEWRDDYPCLPNVAVFTRIKLLGYLDLPGIEFPTAVCAVGNHYGGRVNGLDGNAGVLRTFNLAEQRFRDMFYKGSNAQYSSSAGFAVVTGKYEGKAAFIDLQPLFERVRQMYFTSEENFKKTRDLGPEPGQWPYTFEADPSWKPPVVCVIDVDRPTAVIASMSGGAKARAMIASEDGHVGIYRVGGLATEAPANAGEIKRVAEVNVGRNPTCLAYQKYTSDRIIAVCRGDREIDWIQYGPTAANVIRTLRDARLLDPVFVEQSDTHGIETALMTVTDFKGRQILNYRFGQLVWATQGGQRFGMGPDGKAEFECGGVMKIPGAPFCVSASNVN